MGIRLDYKDESRKSWGYTFGPGERANLSIEQINCGAILRIADAVEAMAKNHAKLIADRDMYERWYREEGEDATVMNDHQEWLYFGCHKQPGHYVWREGMRARHMPNVARLDGALPHQSDKTPYLATISRLGGFGMTALAWWDYSVDSRGGSNSIVLAPSLTIEPEELLAGAQARFPEVFARLPRPVQLRVPR